MSALWEFVCDGVWQCFFGEERIAKKRMELLRAVRGPRGSYALVNAVHLPLLPAANAFSLFSHRKCGENDPRQTRKMNDIAQ